MRNVPLIIALLGLGLLLPPESAAATAEQELFARWLTDALHRPVEPEQVLSWPAAQPPERCRIAQLRPSATGVTAISLRCGESTLPRLLLAELRGNEPSTSGAAQAPLRTPPMVRCGSTLHAELHTDRMHAQVAVVALQSGNEGEEIRVRVKRSNRILRARVLGAREVAILES
jgi:hypothetical protein